MPMRIAVNALTVDARPSGGATYLLDLVGEITRIAGSGYEFYVLTSESAAGLFRKRIRAENAKVVAFPRIVSRSEFRIATEQMFLPIWLSCKRIDLLFAARNVMPILAPCPTVVGVLSMHLNYEFENMSLGRRLYGPLLLRLSARRGNAFVAISEFAARTYMKKYGLCEEKLYVAPCGLSKKLHPGKGGKANPIGGEYLLFVSSLSPHKNVPFLIRVFAEIAKRRGGTKLVIVGRSVRGSQVELQELARQLGLSDRVVFTGAVCDADLSDLYAHASVFVFPSRIEGFGLTPLEAMAHSVPLVVSDRTSIPEVVGDAGIVLSLRDEKPWVDAILRILEDEDLRNELSRRSSERAHLFTWRRAAEVTLSSFKEVLQHEAGSGS